MLFNVVQSCLLFPTRLAIRTVLPCSVLIVSMAKNPSDVENLVKNCLNRIKQDSWFTALFGAIFPFRSKTKIQKKVTEEKLSENGLNGAYRIADKDAKLPKIPVQPISYSDALPLLQQLDGIPVPENWTDWHGGLNASYRLTMDPNNTNNILLNVNTKNEKRYIYDIIGTIRGHEEPDRLVLFGNHHDAWVMGAVDPTSGTSVLMEMARVFGEAYKTGWRPRRTIILCNWDAEEYGLIGSTEWIEDNADMLSSRAVAYLNVDCAVTGNFSIHVDGSDQLANVVFQAAQKVKDPDDESENVYQDWTRSFPDSHNPRYPKIAIPDAGSDHKTFYARYGIPVLDLEYTYDKRFYGDVSSYPVYHSLHDSFHWMKKFADPDFTHHLAIGRVWAQTGLTLADHVILPFNFTRLAWRLNLCVQDFEKTYKGKLAYKIISLDRLKHHISDFTQMSKLFDESVVKISEKSILAVRIANDQMMQVGRAFIAPEGLPGRPLTRHVVFAPARHNSYVGGCFPGMTDTIDDATKHNSSSWTEVKKQLSILEYYMEQAARAMKPAWV